MKRESIERAQEICNELIDLEALLKEFDDIEKELNKIQDDEFYLTFHTRISNMIKFSKKNPYIFESIDFEKKGIEFQIYELKKELEIL